MAREDDARVPDRTKMLLLDEELIAQIQSIAARGSDVIDDFVNLALTYYDAVGEGNIAAARNTLWRSVELLFPYTDAYKAAFDLYVIEQRGMIVGSGSATSLIREVIETQTH